MKKRITKILSTFISSVIVFSSIISTVSAHNINNEENLEFEYASDVVLDYMETNQEYSYNEIAISQAYEFYDFKTGNINGSEYIVFAENEVIGLMYVNMVNGEYCSSYREPENENITEAYKSSSKIAFGYADGKALLYYNNQYYDTNTDTYYTLDIDMPDNIELETVEYNVITNEPQITNYSISTRAFQNDLACQLNVLPVANESINGGLCWCASIASKHNYKYGKLPTDSDYVYTIDVYNIVAGFTGLSSPTGTINNTQMGLIGLGLTNSYKAGSLNMSEVYTELSNNNPIIISVSGTPGAHSLVLSGMTYDQSENTGTYTFADSNFSTPLTVSVSSAAVENGSSFAYTSDVILAAYGGNFTNWYQTYSYEH